MSVSSCSIQAKLALIYFYIHRCCMHYVVTACVHNVYCIMCVLKSM